MDFRYISATTAELWYEDLLEAVRSLESFPNRCTIAPEAQEFQQTIRQRWIGKSRNYRVLFVVEANQVFIVHVRHSSRAFLKKDSEESEAIAYTWPLKQGCPYREYA
jgi:plasmid stabilization system protein ParE